MELAVRRFMASVSNKTITAPRIPVSVQSAVTSSATTNSATRSPTSTDSFQLASAGQSTLDKVLDGFQVVLDIGGFFPGLGEIADATSAGISALRGDYVGAALSAVSLIPIAGDAIGKGAKYLLKASNTPAAKQAAQKLFETVGKTDLAAFYKNLKGALQKVPQVGKRADEALYKISQGLNNVMDTLGKKFGLTPPAMASVSSGGNISGPKLNAPPNRPAGAASGNAATSAVDKMKEKVASAMAKIAKLDLKDMREASQTLANANPTLWGKVLDQFKGNHMSAHVITKENLTKLAEGVQNRHGFFSAFPSEAAAKDAAMVALDKLQKTGLDPINGLPAELRAKIRKLGKDDTIEHNGFKFGYDAKTGNTSVQVPMEYVTGALVAKDGTVVNGRSVKMAFNAGKIQTIYSAR
jgi:hypothetical protein